MSTNKIIFWGLCATLIFLPLPFGSVDEWAIFVFELLTLLLFALHLVGKRASLENNEHRNKSSSSKIPLFLKILLAIFLGITIIQLVPLPQPLLKIISPRSFEILNTLSSEGLIESGTTGAKTLSFSPNLSLYEVLKYICYFLFGFLVYKYVRTKKQIEIFVIVIFLSAIFQTFYGLGELFSGTERIFRYKKKWYLGSATGTFIHKNHFSGFLEMIFPISVGYLLAKANLFAMKEGLTLKEKIVWFSQERLQKSIVIGLIPVSIGIGIFFSRSRTGIFVFFITIFLMIIAVSLAGGKKSERLSRGKRSRKILRAILLMILFSVILIGIKPIIERFSLEALSKEIRPIFYKNTMDLIKTFPLFGTGSGTYVYAYTMFEKIDAHMIVDHAHNDYLEFIAESGIIGGGALILFAFGAFIYIFAKWMKRNDYFVKGIVLGCLMGVLGILIHSLTDFNLRIPANAVYFVTFYALAWRTVKMGRFKNRGARE